MAATEVVKTTIPLAPPTSNTPDEFYKDLYQFHERRGTPIAYLPKISGRVIDLHKLYREVTERGGFHKVNIRDEWDEVVPVVGLRDKCLNATAAIKLIYRRFLDKYERLTFFGEDPDKMEALEAGEALESGRSGRSRYPSLLHSSSSNANALNAVPMAYNYRQHIVNIERRRLNKLSTDLYKASPFEKLMLSLLSPLPNEQDFAINVCTLMSNEAKHTLKLNEHPKLLDVLLAHAGVFADYTLRKLFQHVYGEVRSHSPYGFWRDLLYDKPQILEVYTDEQMLREAALVDSDVDLESLKGTVSSQLEEYLNDDFLNLKRAGGTQDYIGQRVQQIVAILRNLSFFEENLQVFAKNRTFLRFVVMAANVRWGNVHMQALDTAGNIASELELLDPTTDDLSRSLMATICDGIEGLDRAVILNCLEILYKICQKDSNEEYINKCLNLKFYETICLFLSLNDIMLLIYTLEAIYALTSMGSRSCHLLMQVRGIVDQLVALITVEAQSYGPDGCILMRVVETVPGNMLPMVAQNIANLQNVAVVKHQQSPQQALPANSVLSANPATSASVIQIQQPKSEIQQNPPQLQISTEITSQPAPQQPLPSIPPVLKESPLPTQTPATPAPSPATANLQMPQNFTQEDEQYALAWLGATFERVSAGIDSRIDQQELYRMYLAHCQKFGKHSVVNHLQFPRLVRLIFNQSVGPMVARGSDGLDLPGYHYIGIRLRAQPLPIQGKPGSVSIKTGATTTDNSSPMRKIKKKIKPQTIPQQEQANDATNVSGTETKQEIQNKNQNPNLEISESSQSNDTITMNEQTRGNNNEIIEEQPQQQQQLQQMPLQTVGVATAVITETSLQQSQQPQPTTSLIKSLLANKVNQRQQKQTQTTLASSTAGTIVVSQAASAQPIKVTSTAISALVNNPLMQNTPVKVGQTTIKPLNLNHPHHHHHGIEKKTILESTPPPLAPLSGSNVTKDPNGRSIIITNAPANPKLVQTLDPAQIPATIIKRKMDDDITTATTSTTTMPPKRLNLTLDETPVTPSKSAANLYAEIAASILEDEDMEDIPLTTTSNTMQMPTVAPTRTVIEQAPPLAPPPPPPPQQHQQQIVRIQQSLNTVPVSLSNSVQRQLVFHQNQPISQLKAPTLTQQVPTAMATIKTDQGLQTVPVILQQKSLDPHSSQMLGTTSHIAQQASTTQYVLATNPQGQTYLVAQQTPAAPPTPPPPPQTVLFTQTPQQQSAGTKTIIILQQQTIPSNASQNSAPTQQIISTGPGVGSQKMIMTTPQGQQVLVTQRPAATATQGQQQIFINPQTGTATHIQHMPAVTTSLVAVSQQNPTFQRQIIQTTAMSQHHHQQQQQQQQQLQQHAGQISPTLLSQLTHIPATIKLHQPQPPQQQQPPQPATISRITKPVSIIQGSIPTQQISIPQLQQHQSIIQQHIVSGPSEKRQVIIGGGRAIEIKETIITPAQPPLQQSQLNSQTIITTQQQPQQGTLIQTPLHHQQQQQQHQKQQQQQHQKIIAVPIQQQAQIIVSSASASPSVISHKVSDAPTLISTATLNKPQTVIQAGATHVTNIPNMKKASGSLMQVTSTIPQQQQQQQLQHNKMTPTVLGKPSSGPPPLAAVSSTHSVIAGTGNSSPGVPLMKQHSIEATSSETKPNESGASLTTVITQTPTTAFSINMEPKIITNSGTSTIPTSVIQTQSSLPQPSLPQPSLPQSTLPHPSLPTVVIPPIDPNWLYICDWRNCPRRKFKSLNDLQYHVTTVHCPDHLDQGAEIFCQWGAGPGLCDGVPRKRFSLMTHLIDRHLNVEGLRAASQRRIATGTANVQPTQPPVTIMRNIDKTQRANTASPSSSSSATSASTNSLGYAALHAIKRHTADFVNAKELLDENEGPVTKSIRLTAALILRNLVTYTTTAKRCLRRYEPHLANIALSNVESSGALSHVLAELNEP